VNGMAADRAVRLRNQLRAAWKFCLSLRKRDWGLEDYPVAIREQEIDPNYTGTRLKQHRYAASIVNWALAGTSDTEKEALCELEKILTTAKAERVRSGKPLPRPGTHVPIQFASQERVKRHPELAEDFIHRVLNLDWVWISDESSLWDFHHDETNHVLVAKIKEVYGVDVSDIESARLSEILERIATEQRFA
jgi:hypothetical protein